MRGESREQLDDRIQVLRRFGTLRRALRAAATVDEVAEEAVRFATQELGFELASVYCATGSDEDFRLLRTSAEGAAGVASEVARSAPVAQHLVAATTVHRNEDGSISLALRSGPEKLVGIFVVQPPAAHAEVLEELAFDVENALSARVVEQLRAEELAMLEIQERELVGMLREVQERDAIIQRDLEEARQFQQKMLGAPPRVGRAEIEIIYRPLHVVGGDLYSVSADGDRLRLFIADATGHGVRASLTTMFIKSSYDVVRATASGPAALLEALNDNIARAYGSAEMLFSAACADVDLRTGELTFASAAHPPICIVREDGGASLVEGAGAFLGLRARVRFEQQKLALRPGDGVYLFTDGFSEAQAQGGEQFGEHRLRDVVRSAHRGGVSAGAALEAAVLGFASDAGIGDDATFIGARFRGET